MTKVYKGIVFKIVTNPDKNYNEYIVYIYNNYKNRWDKFITGNSIVGCMTVTKEMIDNSKQ